MCCSFGGLFYIPDGYNVFFFWKKTKKKSKKSPVSITVQSTSHEVLRCAILCKLLVILFLLRFVIKTASHAGSCYGDFQQEWARSGCLTGKPLIIILIDKVDRCALLSHTYKCGQYFCKIVVLGGRDAAVWNSYLHRVIICQQMV